MILKCDKHPKYTGKKKPKSICSGCVALYLSKHKKGRSPVKPTKIIKDKTKYTRKNKFKEE